MEILSYDLLSKLLSSKETTVLINENAKTASVNLENRIISLPEYMVKDNDNLSRFVIAHECAHVIYTPTEEWIKIGKEDLKLLHIVNIIEDVRIDQLIALKYPGIVYDYMKGMRYLHDSTDFFRNRKKDYTNIVDKLNYHLKINKSGQMPNNLDLLNNDAKLLDYYNRSINCKNFKDVVELARELYQKENLDDLSISSIYGYSKYKKDSIKPDQILEVVKDYLNGTLKNSVEKIKGNFVITIPGGIKFDSPQKNKKNEIINTDSVLAKKMATRFNQIRNQRNITSIVSKRGEIDCDLLYNYKTDPNIFTRKITKRRMQNHGIVMLIDMSGSMDSNQQLVKTHLSNIVEFCDLLKIPYETYYFDSNYFSQNKFDKFVGSNISIGPNISMKKDIKYDAINNYVPRGGTPLTSSLWCMLNLIPNFMKKYKTEKNIFLLFTDGDDSSGLKDGSVFTFPKTGTITAASGNFINSIPDYTYKAMFSAIKDYCKTTNIVFYMSERKINKELNKELSSCIDMFSNITPNTLKNNQDLFIKEFIRIIA